MSMYRVKLTIHPEDHPGAVVHEGELVRLRNERFIRTSSDGEELITEVPAGGEAATPDTTAKTGTDKDGTQAKAGGPKTTASKE